MPFICIFSLSQQKIYFHKFQQQTSVNQKYNKFKFSSNFFLSSHRINFMYVFISMNEFVELWMFCCLLQSTHSAPDNVLSTQLEVENLLHRVCICIQNRQDEFSYASTDHLIVHTTWCIPRNRKHTVDRLCELLCAFSDAAWIMNEWRD